MTRRLAPTLPVQWDGCSPGAPLCGAASPLLVLISRQTLACDVDLFSLPREKSLPPSPPTALLLYTAACCSCGVPGAWPCVLRSGVGGDGSPLARMAKKPLSRESPGTKI